MKKIFILLIAFTPFNAIRILLYRLIGYKITFKSKIGLFNLINLSHCEIKNATIGSFNLIKCNSLNMDEKSSIGSYNRVREIVLLQIGKSSLIRNHNAISGTIALINSPFKAMENLIIGDNTTITSHHVFDCADCITIGDRVIVGGNNSEFWTHGFTNDRVKIQGPIKIGNDIYIGSRVLVLPSIKINNDCIIASGTTVSKSISESGFYVSSTLVKKSNVKKLRDSEHVIKVKNSQYIRKEI